MSIEDIIKIVEEIRKPVNERLEETGGVMANGYVMACDDILEQLRLIKNKVAINPSTFGPNWLT